MPLLDVSDLLSDPDLCEPLTIIRREQKINDLGRAVLLQTTISPAPYGSIQSKDTAIGGNQLERQPEGQYRAAAFDVYTQFALRGPAVDGCGQDWQPDVIMFNGDPYVVTLINDYTHFGAGYVHAEIASMSQIDQAPVSP